jgi:tetratricopeptide (TPR) repeat protein
MERGWTNAELGQWKEAAADYAKLVALAPDQPSHWDFQASAHLAAGNKKAYSEVCAGMLERFKKTKNPAIAARVVSTCVAAPDSVPDKTELIALAELACSVNREWNARYLGAALYRADKADHALECFREKAKRNSPRAWDLLFMALVHKRLGHTEEARDCLNRATRWLAVVGPSGPKGADKPEPRWENWQEEVIVRVLGAEADTLMNGVDGKRLTPKGK